MSYCLSCLNSSFKQIIAMGNYESYLLLFYSRLGIATNLTRDAFLHEVERRLLNCWETFANPV